MKQFHPEFTQAICRQYTDVAPEPIVLAGHDPQTLWSHSVETPESRGLIQHFANIANEAN